MKYLLVAILFLCSFTSFSQRRLLGQNPSSPFSGGYIYLDTPRNQYLTHPLIAVNDSTIGMDTGRYYISSFGKNATNDSTILTFTDGTRYAAKDSVGTGGGSGGGLEDSAYFWALNGNAATYGKFIGTTINRSFRVRTNNVERAVFDSLGNFGIGIAAPTYKFHVYGSLSGSLAAGIHNPSSHSSATASWAAQNDENRVVTYGMSSSTYTSTTGIGTQRGFMYTDAQRGLALVHNSGLPLSGSIDMYSGINGNVLRFRIDTVGNVGISNATPLYPLDVTGTGRFSTSAISPIHYGGISASNALTLSSTSHATKGSTIFDNWRMDSISRLTNYGAHNTSNYQTRVGTFLIQSYSLNNGFLSDNAHYGTSSWTRLVPGYAGGFQFYNGQLMIHSIGSGTGNFTQAVQFKTDYNGETVMGNNIGTALSDFSGVTFRHNGSGRTFFGGNTSATAKVHIAAGSATASTAPLKFTSGTVLTTPEAGAVEFDGTNYWVTTTGAGRVLLARVVTGTAAPATTPAAVGMQYVDTVNKKMYIATGTASSADWTILN